MPAPATPSDAGLPSRYSAWRNGQDRALEPIFGDRPKKFQILALPTGTGKSLVYMAAANALPGISRTVALTSTKGLQDQLIQDFHSLGLVDVRGMGNYQCKAEPSIKADKGVCVDGDPCWLKESGCYYFDDVRRFQKAKIGVTNYAFWMTHKRHGPSMGQADLLVMDEGHELLDEVCGFERCEFAPGEITFPEDAHSLDMGEWRSWAAAEEVGVARAMAEASRYEKLRLRELRQSLVRLAKSTGEWVPERTKRGWAFEPLWPTAASELLWGDAKRAIIASATIRPKTLQLLGLHQYEYDFIECPSPFPAGRRPIYHIPTVRMRAGMDASELGLWVDRIDQIIAGRLTRKGIIHTVSYDRMQFLLSRSKFASVMLSHTSANTREVVREFKQADAPCILVSPSVHTGYDFPLDEAKYQIIGKVPFPDTRSAITKARCDADKDYGPFVAVQKLVQAAGRINRTPEDYGETFIVDDQIRWVFGKYREFFSKSFIQAYRSVNYIPKASEAA